MACSVVERSPAILIACVHIDTAWLLQNQLHGQQIGFRGCVTELRFRSSSRARIALLYRAPVFLCWLYTYHTTV